MIGPVDDEMERLRALIASCPDCDERLRTEVTPKNFSYPPADKYGPADMRRYADGDGEPHAT